MQTQLGLHLGIRSRGSLGYAFLLDALLILEKADPAPGASLKAWGAPSSLEAGSWSGVCLLRGAGLCSSRPTWLAWLFVSAALSLSDLTEAQASSSLPPDPARPSGLIPGESQFPGVREETRAGGDFTQAQRLWGPRGKTPVRTAWHPADSISSQAGRCRCCPEPGVSAKCSERTDGAADVCGQELISGKQCWPRKRWSHKAPLLSYRDSLETYPSTGSLWRHTVLASPSLPSQSCFLCNLYPAKNGRH